MLQKTEVTTLLLHKPKTLVVTPVGCSAVERFPFRNPIAGDIRGLHRYILTARRKLRGARAVLALTFLVSILAVPATSHGMDAGFTFKWGYDFGGKKLVQAALVHEPSDHRSITANEGEFLNIGLSFIDDSGDFTLDTSIGFKYGLLCSSYEGEFYAPTCTWDSELDVMFSRAPIEALVVYRGITDLRFGAGLTYQIDPILSVSAPLADYKIHFDDAPGYVMELAMTSKAAGGGSAYIGLRYNWLTYKIDGVKAAGANGAGLFIGLTTR